MSSLKDKTVLVGVSGGIAAYKTCSLVSLLKKNGANVYVVMTENATRFVAPLTFETLSANRVTVDMFDRDFEWEVEHVALAKKADLAIVAPATANVIAKLAVGIADDFLTTTLLACKCPIVIAPAMNTAMLENAVTVKNINELAARGFKIVHGGAGRLACGDCGNGRMAEPDVLFSAVCDGLCKNLDYAGKTVLVTSGATRAPVDPVRFLSNRSSGKMGYSLAVAAKQRGAKVIYVKGFTDDLPLDKSFDVVDVSTTAELYSAVKDNYERADAVIMAAAPCDYDIQVAPQKIKSESVTLNLTKTVDCAKFVGEHKGSRKLVIFAAETENQVRNAQKKLADKKADIVVLNDVTVPGAGFDCETNIATLITDSTREDLPLMSKRDLADRILDSLVKML